MPKRILELDGLRGLAAILVLIAHYFGETTHGFRPLTAGWIGVDLFFVLSGFLIGTIILDNHDKPGFFWKFYLRRGARIVPVYGIVCILTLAAVALTAGHEWSDHPIDFWIYGSFSTNIAMTLWGGGGEWLKPTWTLAVEEQFYLVMPVLIAITPRRTLLPLLILLFCGSLAFRLGFASTHPQAALTLLPGRSDLLIAGVALALLHGSLDLKRYVLPLRLLSVASIACMLAVILIIPGSAGTLGQTLLSIGIASFIGAIIGGAPEGSRYKAPWLRWFGRISYALYLVHQPIAGLLHGLLLNGTPDVGTYAQVTVSLLAAGVSVAAAWASWRWLESPVLKLARALRFENEYEAGNLREPASDPRSLQPAQS